MDGVPQAQQAEPPYVYAATDERPRGEREVALCQKASRFDWLYYAMPLALDVGSISLDYVLPKYYHPEARGLRYFAASAIGFSLGWTLSGGYLSAPKCSMSWVGSAPPEGDVRTTWQLATAFALLAGATAPIVVATVTGPVPNDWPEGERQMRLVMAGLGGVAGAIFPYLVPPKTWRAARELRHVQAGATPDGKGAFLSYTARF